MVLEKKISEVEHELREASRHPWEPRTSWVLGSSEPTPEEPLRRGGSQGGSGSSPPTGSPIVLSRLSQYRRCCGQHCYILRCPTPRTPCHRLRLRDPHNHPASFFFSKSLNFFNCSDIISLDTCGFDASWCDAACLVCTCRLFDVTVTRQEFVVSAEKKTAGRNRASVFGKRRNSSTKL